MGRAIAVIDRHRMIALRIAAAHRLGDFSACILLQPKDAQIAIAITGLASQIGQGNTMPTRKR